MEKGKSTKKTVFIIVGAVVAAIVVLGAAFGIVSSVQKKREAERIEAQRLLELQQRQELYSKGEELYESGSYAAALEIFDELGTFEDSETLAQQAQNEIDAREVPSLAASGKYNEAAEILRERSKLFAGTEKGTQAQELAVEYETLNGALKAMEAGDYSSAAQGFNALKTFGDVFSKQANLCDAHVCAKNKDWSGVLTSLYAYENGVTKSGFVISDDNTDTYKQIVEAAKNNDGETLLSLVNVTSDEAVKLKEYAQNGFAYDKAGELLDAGDYEGGIAAFEALDGFLDSASRAASAKSEYEEIEAEYQEALKLYNSKNFYKAKLTFEDILDYKDSQKKYDSCKQSLPKNGALKKNSGSIKLTIQAPEGNESVLVRVYTSGEVTSQVFISPGKKASIKVKKGTHTIKVGYGTEWYGSDLFGPSGDYMQLYNGSSDSFSFQSGYSYTLKLMVSSGGNVGSSGVGLDDM